MTLARFTRIWTSGEYPPEPVAETDLDGVEQRLGVQLPQDYRRAILEVGLPQPTIALLAAIVERDLDLHCPGDFYTPSEIIEETINWREIGMPEQLIAFAGDDCGNKFCFHAGQLKSGRAAEQAIWFYDHDFETAKEIARSFDAWIKALCDVKPLREGDAR